MQGVDFILWSASTLFLLVRSDVEYLNLTPFLQIYNNCHINLILYKRVDFISKTTPIVASRPLYDQYENNTLCKSGGTRSNIGGKYTFNLNSDVCPLVLKNYLKRGIQCVGVVALYPESAHVEEKEIYWYLNHYWSRSEFQEFSFSRVNSSKGRPNRNDRTHPPSFPTEIFIFTFIPPESFILRRELMLRREIPLKPTWEVFMQLFILTIAIDKLDPLNRQLQCTFALSTKHLAYFTTYSQTIHDGQGIDMRKYAAEIEKFKKSRIILVINSRLREPHKQHQKVSYNVLEVEERIEVFLRRAFNRSVRLANLNRRDKNFWTIDIRLRPFQPIDIGSNVLFLPVVDVHKAALTCAGLSPQISFHAYIRPYTGASWGAIFMACISSCILFKPWKRYQRVWERLPLLLISILLEKSCNLGNPGFRICSFRLLLGSYLLMGIILSNGYKGVVITSLVKPFELKRVESLEEGIDLGYLSLRQHSEHLMSRRCCESQLGLMNAIKPLMDPDYEDPLVESGRIKTCGDYLVYEEQFDIIRNAPIQFTEFITLLKNISRGGGIYNFPIEEIPNRKTRLLVKLARSTRPVPCGKFAAIEVRTCAKLMDVDAVDFLKHASYVDKFNPKKKLDRRLYILEDKTRLLRVIKWGLVISPMNLARKILVQDLMTFVESGIQKNIQERLEYANFLISVSMLRWAFGKMEDESIIPVPLNLRTRIRLLFYIYIICILFSIVAFLLAMTRTLKLSNIFSTRSRVTVLKSVERQRLFFNSRYPMPK